MTATTLRSVADVDMPHLRTRALARPDLPHAPFPTGSASVRSCPGNATSPAAVRVLDDLGPLQGDEAPAAGLLEQRIQRGKRRPDALLGVDDLDQDRQILGQA